MLADDLAQKYCHPQTQKDRSEATFALLSILGLGVGLGRRGTSRALISR